MLWVHRRFLNVFCSFALSCHAKGSNLCRQCFFNTPLYLEKNDLTPETIPEYPDCPCCVLDIYPNDEAAANLDGPRCESGWVERCYDSTVPSHAKLNVENVEGACLKRVEFILKTRWGYAFVVTVRERLVGCVY